MKSSPFDYSYNYNRKTALRFAAVAAVLLLAYATVAALIACPRADRHDTQRNVVEGARTLVGVKGRGAAITSKICRAVDETGFFQRGNRETPQVRMR